MALGGIGGFNAHDAGVLKAAHDCRLHLDVITCTSGAVFWTYHYLTDPDGIAAEVQRQADSASAARAIPVALLGEPGIFTPAYAEYWKRWFSPWKGVSVNELL